jgi:hypothetical protein
MTARSGIGFVLMLGVSACTSSRSSAEDTALASYVLPALPKDVQRRQLINFEGKLALLGYDVEPVGRVMPGSVVTLRLYWQRLGPLEAGWQPFTHVVDAFDVRRVKVEDKGPLRSKLPPHTWQLGKVYVDEQTLNIPQEMPSEATVLVGVWRPGYVVGGNPGVRSADLRLQVIGGSDDGQNRGIVLYIDTGKKPQPRWLWRRKS